MAGEVWCATAAERDWHVEQEARCRQMWAAVLLDALRSAARARFRRWERGANVTALEWLHDESHSVGSCAWVCGIIGEDVAVVRAYGDLRQPVPQRRSAPRTAA